MSPTLYHPHTARAIDVSDGQADDWRDLGWLDEKPETDAKGDDKTDDADQGDDDKAAADGDAEDAPEGDTEPADAAAGDDEAAATPAPAKTTKTTTRGRAKK